jgi:hypothetical protein
MVKNRCKAGVLLNVEAASDCCYCCQGRVLLDCPFSWPGSFTEPGGRRGARVRTVPTILILGPGHDSGPTVGPGGGARQFCR